MKAVIQRVRHASVTVEGRVTGRIGPGLLVFVGVGPDDGGRDVEFIADKVVNLRVFEDDGGKMNRSVTDIGGAVLLISQFTLFGDCRKGRRPDFTAAGPPALAQSVYNDVIEAVRQKGVGVQTGVFAADMQIEALNDGPVTLLLDSRKS
jgi:D-aminoacyl-tRNA deacylase